MKATRAAQEILDRHRLAGRSGADLAHALRRHAGVLAASDPDVAVELERKAEASSAPPPRWRAPDASPQLSRSRQVVRELAAQLGVSPGEVMRSREHLARVRWLAAAKFGMSAVEVARELR